MASFGDKTFSALILAGGESRRFGSNKALAPYGTGSLISHIASILKPHFSEIIISAGNPADFKDLGLPICTDILRNKGPIAGIHAGLRSASSEYLFVTACDMPFISARLISALRLEAETGCRSAVVAGRNGFIEPFPGYYSVSLAEQIERSAVPQARGIFSFLKEINPAVINFDDDGSFYNINRPTDLQNIRFPIR